MNGIGTGHMQQSGKRFSQEDDQSVVSVRSIVIVALLSGMSGFGMGLLYQSWQVAVESAQVVAGIVQYPAQNSFGMYHLHTWTILHQILALFLRMGVSEITLSVLLSGVIGMVCFQSLALGVLAVSSDAILALFAPFLITFVSNSSYVGMALPGVTYPLMFMGYQHTYGMLGLSFVFLVIALFGLGQYKIGGGLLGIAIAIHPALGLFCNLIVATCLILDFQRLRDDFSAATKYIIFGYSVSAVSLVFHLLGTNDSVRIDSILASDYLSAFLRYWDAHRHPFNLLTDSVFFVLLGLCLSLFWLLVWKRDIPAKSLFILRSFVVSGLIGGVLSISYWLPSQIVPKFLLVMMPARLLNLNVLGCAILLVGLMGRYKNSFWIQINLIALVIMMLLPFNDYQYMLFSGCLFMLLAGSHQKLPPIDIKLDIKTLADNSEFFGELFLIMLGFFVFSQSIVFQIFFLGHRLAKELGALLIVIGVFALLISVFFRLYAVPRKNRISSYINNLTNRLPAIEIKTLAAIIKFSALALTVILAVSNGYSAWQIRKENLRDWTNDPLLAEVNIGQGMLLTSSNLGLIQLRTRRPILLNGESLDSLPYVPESGPEMNQVLQIVYGIDLFNPPEDIRKVHPGGLLKASGKALWESRTPEQWSEIGKQFNVTDIVTYADWELNLPQIISNAEFALYRIP